MEGAHRQPKWLNCWLAGGRSGVQPRPPINPCEVVPTQLNYKENCGDRASAWEVEWKQFASCFQLKSPLGYRSH